MYHLTELIGRDEFSMKYSTVVYRSGIATGSYHDEENLRTRTNTKFKNHTHIEYATKLLMRAS